MNTLSRRPTTARQPTFNKPLKKPLQAFRQLDTRTSTGNNVRFSTLEFEGDSFLSQLPPTKRRKTEPQPSSQNTPLVVECSGDEDQLGVEDVVKGRHILRDNEDATSVVNPSQASSKPSQRNALSGIPLQEHRMVEKLMRTSIPNSRQRKNRDRKRYRDSSGTPKSSHASSLSDPIEVVDGVKSHNPVIKTSYKGTAESQLSPELQGTGQDAPRRSTEYRSLHFPQPLMLRSNMQESSAMVAGSRSPAISNDLRNQYRDSNGDLRGHRTSASSDELTATDPNTRALSPVKSLRPKSPQISPQPDSLPKALPEHGSKVDRILDSDIRPSTFIDSGKTAAKSSSRTVQEISAHEEPAPWNVSLRAYLFQGKTYEEDGLGLVYKDSTKSYDIHCSGVNLAKDHPQLQIRPPKLQKVFFALYGTKMRFESSKTGTLDNVLDVDLGSKDDVQLLNAVLQENGSLYVKGLPGCVYLFMSISISSSDRPSRERMDRVWDHKIKELQRPMTRGKAPIASSPEDVKLAGRRLERADKKRAPDTKQQSNTKRPRLIDILASNGQSGNHVITRHDEISLGKNTPKPSKAIRKSDSVASDRFIMQAPEVPPSYLLRSRTGGEALPQWPTDIASKITRDYVEKYSKTHDMGKSWSKPLVYPKEGKKRTTVEWGDLERLDEGEFLNDNIIAFYLRYLEVQAEQADPTISRKVYMFNTFFYERLTAADAEHKGFNYDAIRKWTRGVDIFTYDFVVVPVNESAHWYIAIICNLPSTRRRPEGFGNGLDSVFRPGNNEDASGQITLEHGHSSPSPQITSGDNEDHEEVSLLQNAPLSTKEQEAAASFAEMSLDTKDGNLLQGFKSTHCDLRDSESVADQEQLDDQLRQVVERTSGQTSPNAQELQQDGDIDKEIEQIEKSVLGQIKQKKRKSLPSPRSFDPYKPTILTFDSFGTPHPQTIKVLKQYLREEANDKRAQKEFSEKELQGVTAKQIPQQDNFCDCGLYLLGYMEKFFDNPREFIDKVMRKQWDLVKDWAKLEPSSMRTKIRELLLELEKKNRQEKQSNKSPKPLSKTSKGPDERPRPLLPDVSNLPSARIYENERPLPPVAPKVPGGLNSKADISHPLASPTGELPQSIEPSITEQLPARRPLPKSPLAEPQANHSFIVLDSQSQPAVPASSSINPSACQDPESLAISPDLPSTIPDSQPLPANPPLEELPRKATTPPPQPAKAKRRIESFSSPLAPPAARAVPVAATTRSSLSPRLSARRNVTKSSRLEPAATMIATDPKVVISIDD
ncbi:MAG: hypothetical protein Q9220_004107 [cf. Caloplaca sp. 1 TL-2023]